MAKKRIELKDSGVIFNEQDHTYLLGDKYLSGITAMLQRQFFPSEFEGIPKHIVDAAAEYGTGVHASCEDFDHSWINDGTVEVQDYIKICKDYNLTHECSEYTVTDGKEWASRIDKVYRVSDDTFDLGDIKTYGQMTAEKLEKARWQLSIYAYLFERQNPEIKVPHLYAIHIRNGQAKLIEVQRVADEEVAEVLRCEVAGERYVQKYAPADARLILSDAEALTLVDAETKIAAYDAATKALKASSEAIKDKLYQYMLANNLEEMSCPGGVFKLKKPYETTRVNSAKLKSKYPEIAAEVSSVSEVKGSVSFKPNE